MPRKIVIFVLAGLLLVGVCLGAQVLICEQLKHAPQAPIYPGATLVNQVSRGITTRRPMVTYDYLSTDPAEKVIAFYEAKGYCGAGDKVKGRELCRGNAIPFGEYFVYIDLDSYLSRGVTSYAIEVRWHGCSTGLE